ncbi:polyadenylate-binding protein-interacting protein 9-like protein, partial [Tanacetum coccineum]
MSCYSVHPGITDRFISKRTCVCGAKDRLADELLPNKTLMEELRPNARSLRHCSNIRGRALLADKAQHKQVAVDAGMLGAQVPAAYCAQLTAFVSNWHFVMKVLDCRVCGHPHSRLRFAFVEFANEYSSRAALNLSGIMLGFSQVKVLPSKITILLMNPTFLPRSEDEKEMCAQTAYCTNIYKKVSQAEFKIFLKQDVARSL